MAGMLADGTKLRTTSGEDVTVAGLIGAGGQGEVYRARHRKTGKALKWYYPELATASQRAITEDLVARQFGDNRFLWPQAMVTAGPAGFGYLMNLRPPQFEGLPALFRRQARIKPRELLSACIHLVEAYRALHSQGIAYRDISQGNVFFDPATGDILVCDNDNAIAEGNQTGIEGTMEFMAPELVRADPGATPCTQTDLHSLAVLLFMMLINHHPLQGALEYRIRCLDEKAKAQLYGKDPVFVFDPADTRNRPVTGVHTTVQVTWDATPATLRTLFTEAFTAGLHHPQQRIRETQWRDALSAARDMIVYCQRCGRQNMTDPEEIGARRCWSCDETLTPPPVIEITTPAPRITRIIALAPDAKIFAHHLAPDPARHDFTSVTAAVTEHPRRPGRYGLTNRTTSGWAARRRDGSPVDVPPGKSIDIAEGTRFQIGPNQAVIRRLPT
jgi:hypothetical protein